MAKKAKNDKVIDLKPKAEKITTEHLEELQRIASQFDMYHQEIGVAETRKHSLLHVVGQLQEQMKVLQAKMKDSYGDVDIDIRNGDIKYPENGEVDKKD
tara:strand:+ start:242 stop:538 length:297 start_codon:yes stop_codon:yes gene_type:complete